VWVIRLLAKDRYGWILDIRVLDDVSRHKAGQPSNPFRA
jgi:hypothetical protein